MSWPTNDTGLSVPAVLKWLLVIFTIPLWFSAYEGIIKQEVATGGRVPDRLLLGTDATKFGVCNLVFALALLAAAWAIWRFWESNID